MDRDDQRDHGVKPGNKRGRRAAGPDPIIEAGRNGLLEKARQIVDQTPEVRSDRVAAIKAALARGSYAIDSRKLANALITELLLRR
jgi:flagellar biosynthesis anti-sigma factor FlgM